MLRQNFEDLFRFGERKDKQRSEYGNKGVSWLNKLYLAGTCTEAGVAN